MIVREARVCARWREQGLCGRISRKTSGADEGRAREQEEGEKKRRRDILVDSRWRVGECLSAIIHGSRSPRYRPIVGRTSLHEYKERRASFGLFGLFVSSCKFDSTSAIFVSARHIDDLASCASHSPALRAVHDSPLLRSTALLPSLCSIPSLNVYTDKTKNRNISHNFASSVLLASRGHSTLTVYQQILLRQPPFSFRNGPTYCRPQSHRHRNHGPRTSMEIPPLGYATPHCLISHGSYNTVAVYRCCGFKDRLLLIKKNVPFGECSEAVGGRSHNSLLSWEIPYKILMDRRR